MQSISTFIGNQSKRLVNVVTKRSAGIVGLGLFVGITAVSMWQQWGLTFGSDPQLLLVVSLVVAIRFWVGQKWYISRSRIAGKQSLTTLILCLAAWSILFPFWIDALTTFTGIVPLSYLNHEYSKIPVFFALAVAGWAIPGMLW